MPDKYLMEYFLYYILRNRKDIRVYKNIGKVKFISDMTA